MLKIIFNVTHKYGYTTVMYTVTNIYTYNDIALGILYMYEGIQSTYTHVLYILTTGQLIQVTLNKSLVKLYSLLRAHM